MNREQLKPCPFCGKHFKWVAEKPHRIYKLSETPKTRVQHHENGCALENIEFISLTAWNRRSK